MLGTGEIVRIVYMAGTQPGTSRDITVRRIDDVYLYANCLTAGGYRTFRLDRIELSADMSSGPTYTPGAVVRIETFDQLVEVSAPYLDRPEWHVVRGLASLSVHRRRKNGAPLKRPHLAIRYVEGVPHPWELSRADGGARRFKYIDRLSAAFFEDLDVTRHDESAPSTSTADDRVSSPAASSISPEPSADSGFIGKFLRVIGWR